MGGNQIGGAPPAVSPPRFSAELCPGWLRGLPAAAVCGAAGAPPGTGVARADSHAGAAEASSSAGSRPRGRALRVWREREGRGDEAAGRGKASGADPATERKGSAGRGGRRRPPSASLPRPGPGGGLVPAAPGGSSGEGGVSPRCDSNAPLPPVEAPHPTPRLFPELRPPRSLADCGRLDAALLRSRSGASPSLPPGLRRGASFRLPAALEGSPFGRTPFQGGGLLEAAARCCQASVLAPSPLSPSAPHLGRLAPGEPAPD